MRVRAAVQHSGQCLVSNEPPCVCGPAWKTTSPLGRFGVWK